MKRLQQPNFKTVLYIPELSTGPRCSLFRKQKRLPDCSRIGTEKISYIKMSVINYVTDYSVLLEVGAVQICR
jgi:hypothetical protein